MANIAFVEANNNGGTGYSPHTKCNDCEPLGLEFLAGAAKSKGHTVRVFQQERPKKEFLQEVLSFQPEILALSCMAFNYDSSVKFAEESKKAIPHLRVIVGGPHISSNPQGLEQALKERTIDAGIKGEADLSFLSWLDSNTPERVDGAVYLGDNGKVKVNPVASRIKNLDALPFAFRDRDILSRARIGKIMFPALLDQVSSAVVAYSRGCPHLCSFCDSRSIWGNNVVWRSASNVADEIEYLNKTYGTNTLFFSDLTFNANPNKVEELCDELIKRKLGDRVKSYVLMRAAIPNGTKALVDRDLLERMAQAGFTKFAYGFDGVIPEVQRGFRKIISNDLMRELVEEGHGVGILSKGSIIIGDPKYARKELEETPKALEEVGFDEIRISFLTPFPGSKLYHESKANGQLLTENLRNFTTDVPVLACDGISPQKLLEGRKAIARDYYTSKAYQQMVSRQISRFPHLRKSYEEHYDFLKRKGVI